MTVAEYTLKKPFAATTRHGTTTAYNNYGCRCDECRAAHAATNRRRNASRPPLAADDPRHGHESTYTNHKCRCDACREAWNAYWRRYRATRRASS